MVVPRVNGSQTRSRHGLNATMARVTLRGFRAIDRRTAAAREVMAFRRELASALGGDTALSPQRRKLIDLAARAALVLDHLDGWLAEQPTLVNKRSRSVIPALVQRQVLADHLARLFDKLGLDRVPPRVPTLADVVLDIERQKTAGATDDADPVSTPTDGGDRSPEDAPGAEDVS